jgi:2-phosphosulfolactate phosphatase
MKADVVLLPRDLNAAALEGRVVVVFDVLRATTSIIAALAAGVAEVRVLENLEAARAAAAQFAGPRLLCGEQRCLRPEGFDLGNSPGEFTPAHAGKTLFMSTTNGTRALLAAQHAGTVLAGALVNAAAIAKSVAQFGRDLTLLCAGTDGRVAMDDVLGAGAVLEALRQFTYVELASDIARIALRLFGSCQDDLRGALAQATGGQNVLRAGLDGDLDFAARLSSIDVVGVLRPGPLRVSLLRL